MHFVFDLETTGLPVRGKYGFYPYKMVSKYNTARIVSVSWMVLDSKLKETEKRYYVIKPDGFQIPKEAIAIHGISNREANETGIDCKTVLKDLEKSITRCDTLVAHNINFDMNILMSELYRTKLLDCIDHVKGMNRYCTMLNGKKQMNVKKYPKLSELYFHLTKKTITNAHNALYDTEHCCECYKVLLTNQQSNTIHPSAANVNQATTVSS